MKVLFITIFIFSSIFLRGQEWAPIGAEWYYDESYAWSGNIDYHRIYCDSIVNINDQDCKRIIMGYCSCVNRFCGDVYTYEINDTIFFFNPEIDSFQILYDFNAIPGDEWIINTKDEYLFEEIIIHVDSISTMDINNYNLPVFYVTYKYYFDMGFGMESDKEVNSTVIKNIGDINFLINVIPYWEGACDVNYISKLRCYQDSVIGFYSTGLRDSCDYNYVWTSTQKNQVSKINIFPNPVIDYLNLRIDGETKIEYQLFDTKGQLIITGNNTRIDLRTLETGIYFIKIITDNTYSATYKIIKHLP